MTEGIIPTAFKKMIRKHNDPSKVRTYDQFDHEEILQLQQDLIEEIVKSPYPYLHKENLIGKQE